MEYQSIETRLQNYGITTLAGSEAFTIGDNPWYPDGPNTTGTTTTPWVPTVEPYAPHTEPLPAPNGLPNGTTFQILPQNDIDLEALKKHLIALQDHIINLFKAGDLKQAAFCSLVEEIKKMEAVLLGVPEKVEEPDEGDDL